MLLSDIHGNNTAFQWALAYADSLPEAEFWVLGDIVGYLPQPTVYERQQAAKPPIAVSEIT